MDRPSVWPVRFDREPRHSSLAFHQSADDWFQKRFGIRYRSQALFVTSRQLSASAYAHRHMHVVRVVPLSAYRFCWSPNISDLFLASKPYVTSSEEEIWGFLNSISYLESDLSAAYECGHEVMLHCERYVALPLDPLKKE